MRGHGGDDGLVRLPVVGRSRDGDPQRRGAEFLYTRAARARNDDDGESHTGIVHRVMRPVQSKAAKPL
jgi:hypothetical protein